MTTGDDLTRCFQVEKSSRYSRYHSQSVVNMKSTKVLKNLPIILTGKKGKSSKKTIKRKTNSCVRLVGNIRAFTVLSLSKRKLNSLDDEEELFRSVLISNTMKSVRQEMTGSCRQGTIFYQKIRLPFLQPTKTN